MYVIGKNESISKAKKETDRTNLRMKIEAMNKKSILHDSPPQSDVEKEVSPQKRNTSPIQKSHKSAEEDLEISSNDSSPSAREVQRRIAEKKRELEELNGILHKDNSQKMKGSKTNRRLPFNKGKVVVHK